MEIKGFQEISMVDWEEKISSVIFLPGCNFRCPFCFNLDLVLHPESIKTIPWETIEKYLIDKKGWIDGVVITGGESTIQPFNELLLLCKKIKSLSYPIKLDTNGTNPSALSILISEKLIDYVALDLKHSLTPNKYGKAIGLEDHLEIFRGIQEIIASLNLLLLENIGFELRTTLVPGIHSPLDIQDLTYDIIYHAAKSNKKYEDIKYFLQRFKEDVKILNPSYRTKQFTEKEYEDFLRRAKKNLPNTKLR